MYIVQVHFTKPITEELRPLRKVLLPMSSAPGSTQKNTAGLAVCQEMPFSPQLEGFYCFTVQWASFLHLILSDQT